MLLSQYEFLYSSLVIKLQSLMCPWCWCSCLSWVRCLRLYVMLQIVVEVAGTVCDADCSIFSQTVYRQRPPAAVWSLACQVDRSRIACCDWEMRLGLRVGVGGLSPWWTRSTRVTRTSAAIRICIWIWMNCCLYCQARINPWCSCKHNGLCLSDLTNWLANECAIIISTTAVRCRNCRK